MLCNHKGVKLTMERNQKKYNRLIRDIRPILIRHYGEARADKMLRDTQPVNERFLAETPSIGGKKNPMSVNMDVA